MAAKESTIVEKQSSAPVALQPKPALQLSETRVLKVEEDTFEAKTEKEVDPVVQNSSVSLSSAMLGSSESKAAIDKLETALSAPKSEFKTGSALEMFAPAPEKVSEPELDPPSDHDEDSAANLRANAVPAFGGLGQQPFAGIEPGNGKQRGLLIGGLVAAMVVAGFAGAWFYAPGFQKTVQWEYSRIHNQFQGSQAKPAATAALQPVSVPTPVPTQAPPTDSTTNPPANLVGTSGTPLPAQTSAVPAPAANPALAAAPAAAVTTSSQNVPAPKSSSTSSAPGSVAASSAGAALVNTSATTTTTASAKPADLFEVPEDYADDQVIHRVHPAYPNAARARKLQGAVVLQAIINKQGKVDSLQLVSGDPLLAQAAADAVKQWRYKPYSHNGDPVEFQTRVTVDFKLP
jgi:TonB family protein